MSRLPLLVLLCLLALTAPTATAYANHDRDDREWEEEPVWDEPADDRSWEDEEEEWEEDEPQPLPVEEPAPLPEAGDGEPWDDDRDDWEPRQPQREEQPPIVRGKTVLGLHARMRADGRAAVPLGAPVRVRRLISAINEIIGKPYKWGGGHGRIFDRGYDCSGSVSYGLIRTGLLGSPLVSGGFARWGLAGAGRWVTIYANSGHVYMEIAGLRLDTSSMGDRDRRKGVRWRGTIGRRPGFKVRHIAGL